MTQKNRQKKILIIYRFFIIFYLKIKELLVQKNSYYLQVTVGVFFLTRSKHTISSYQNLQIFLYQNIYLSLSKHINILIKKRTFILIKTTSLLLIKTCKFLHIKTQIFSSKYQPFFSSKQHLIFL